ncbi:MAG: hypothetical protein GIKADHBN_01029 [Phycisphaerales bacterium]|nr:hypothetical protein [Phycisphaerales bacterium]
MKKSLVSVVGLCLAAGVAQASIAFSFADPPNGRQLTNVKDGVAPGISLMTYDMGAPLVFYVDGTEESLGVLTFGNARMELRFELSPAVTIGGVTTAPVAGFFRVFNADSGQDIVTGRSNDGAFVRVAGTNSILFSSPDGFTYAEGPELISWLPSGQTLAADQEAVFTLTDVLVAGGGSMFAAGGVFKDFAANASFSGTSALVPAPGAIALAGIGGLLVARRKR